MRNKRDVHFSRLREERGIAKGSWCGKGVVGRWVLVGGCERRR